MIEMTYKRWILKSESVMKILPSINMFMINGHISRVQDFWDTNLSALISISYAIYSIRVGKNELFLIHILNK
jgi:hypothetical protein